MPRLTPNERRAVLRKLLGTARTGAGQQSGGFFGRMRNRFGAVGELIALAADAIAGARTPKGKPQPTDADIAAATRMLQTEGFEITPQAGGELIPPPIVQNPTRPTSPQRPRGPITPSGAPTRSRTSGLASGDPGAPQPGAEPWPEEGVVQTYPTRIRGAIESVPFEEFTPWILTPQSTHIHAIAYDESEGILYVWYRAQAKPISYIQMVSICSGKAYKCGVRPDIPGPIYSYGGAGKKVPRSIFTAMISASHPGKIVWSDLRVCGSTWQHQYPYTLTDVPMGHEIPRRATRLGLAVRTVPTICQGRRGYRQSTLPPTNRPTNR